MVGNDAFWCGPLTKPRQLAATLQLAIATAIAAVVAPVAVVAATAA